MYRRSFLPIALVAMALAGCGDATAPDTRAAGARIQPVAPTFESHASTPLPGQYIVLYRGKPNMATLTKLLFEGHPSRGKLSRVFTHAVNGFAAQLSDSMVAVLAADTSIAVIEQDAVMSAISTVETPAPWGLDRIDQRALPLSASYTYTPNGSGVTVYIIDTGINLTHADFGGRAVAGADLVTPGGTTLDCHGHGTHVSGTVGGATYGVAKGAKLVAVRVLDCTGSGTTSGVIAGVDWVTQQKQANPATPMVANMSLGGGASSSLDAAVANSIAAGVTYAIAAGNSAMNACLASPARVSTAITVGATTSSDAFASFSNYGSCVKINAPGVSISSDWIGSATATATISGTSMASPHVAGAAAAYLSANPTATPAQVQSALTSNATSGAVTGVPAGTTNALLYVGFLNPVAPPPPPSANCVAIVGAVQGSPITPVTMTGSGGAGGPYTFSSTTLPAGLVISTSGTISGTPTASGIFNYTIVVKDKDGTAANVNCSVTIATIPSASCVAIVAVQGVAITPVTMTGTGGTGGPYTFSSSNLPAGLVISTSGTISGTPTASGTFSYTITVKDKDGHGSDINCSVTVAPPASAGCVAIVGAQQGNPITPVTMIGSGGAGGPYTFSSTNLPAGLVISTSGTISGTPTVNGSFSYTVTVKDKNGNGSDINCSLTIAPPASPPPPPPSANVAIKGAASGKCINAGTSQTAGKIPFLFQCSPGTLNEVWNVGSVGTAAPISIYAGALCMADYSGTGAEGAPIVTAICNGSLAQKWTLTAAGQIKHATSGKCLAARFESTATYTSIVLSTCTSSTSMLWSTEPR